MKKTMAFIALALFLSSPAFALTRDDFSFRASAEGVKINARVFVKGDYPAVNVTINFSNIPEGITLREDPVKRVPLIGSKSLVQVSWRATITNDNPDFTDSFEVLSWDDSISLVAFLVDPATNKTVNGSLETGEPEIWIFGKSDGIELCEQMSLLPEEETNPTWGSEGTCNAKVRVNGQVPVYVNDTGHFAIKTKFENSGLNQLNVTAIDASGNTNSVTLEAVYTGSVSKIPDVPDIDFDIMAILSIILVFVIFMVIALAAIFVIVTLKKKAKGRKKETPEKKEEIIAVKKLDKKGKAKETALDKLKRRKQDAIDVLDQVSLKSELTKRDKEKQKKAKKELKEAGSILMANEEFLLELEERAFAALIDAREGKSSKKIKKELINEGYTDREITKIREYFIKGKS